MSGIVRDARAYQRDMASLAEQVLRLLLRLWAQIDRAHIAESWVELVPDAAALVVAGQTVAAELADPYLTAVLGDEVNRGRINPEAFAGATPAGDSVESLLYLPTIDAKQRIAAGASPAGALRQARAPLTMYAQTTVADAGRLATAAGMASRPHAAGYYRMLTPPSCARCAILAGKWFRYNAGFQRHPRCFPAGVAVSGPQALAASRRWYEGELVVLATAGGQRLSLTGNHPVLTRRGWVPANLLQEGDEVVRSTRTQGATPLVVPDHQQMPALVEDVWSALGMGGLHRMPTTAEDFHGDGQDGEVDVVYADRALSRVAHPALVEQPGEAALTIRGELAGLFDLQRVPVFVDAGHVAQPSGDVGGLGLALALLGGHSGGAHLAGGARVAALDAMLGETALDDIAADAVLTSQRVLTGADEVRGGDRLDGKCLVAPRWDAPGGPLTVENRSAYAGRGADLLERLAGQVELDRLVDVRRVEWSGHVYSLTSVEGWHTANSLIVSNCDCVHIPVQEADDSLLFDTRKAIEAGKVTGLSKADTAAIVEYGADPAQVVNARRSMYTAGGRRFTREGATRTGIAGARILERDLQRLLGNEVRGQTFRNWTFSRQKALEYSELLRKGKTYTRLTKSGRTQAYAYRYARTARPTPEQILADATSREEAVRLLINFGYIL